MVVRNRERWEEGKERSRGLRRRRTVGKKWEEEKEKKGRKRRMLCITSPQRIINKLSVCVSTYLLRARTHWQ
jgi:hypothetical protein